jgi:hypothetical protein
MPEDAGQASHISRDLDGLGDPNHLSFAQKGLLRLQMHYIAVDSLMTHKWEKNVTVPCAAQKLSKSSKNMILP